MSTPGVEKVIGMAVVAAGVAGLAMIVDDAVNVTQATARVVERSKLPALGGGTRLMVRLSGLRQPASGWVVIGSGLTGAADEADHALFAELRPGCSYEVALYRTNPRGADPDYRLRAATLVAC